jgi:diguanylate cyclase (GGDEF)-like protein/PAS domain S-box-containing protein
MVATAATTSTATSISVLRAPGEPAPPICAGITALEDAEKRASDAVARLAATEQAMRDGNARMQALLDHAAISILVSDREGRYVVANQVSAEHLDRPVEEILGRGPAELYEPAVAAAVLSDDARVRDGSGPITFQATIPRHGAVSGDLRDLLVTKYPVTDADGQIIGVGTLALDITQRKRAEAEAARMVEIIESTDAAVVGMTTDGRILTWNPAAERLYGYTAEEVVGRQALFLVPPDRLGELTAQRTQINGGDRVGEIETVRRRKDGTDIDVAIALSPLLDSAGEVIGASSIVRDITAQKAMRDELRASEERFRATIDHAPIGIALLSPTGRTLRVNRALCKMLGYDRDQLLVLTPPQITHPDDLATDAQLVRGLLAEELPSYETEKRYIRADGSVVSTQVSVSLVRDHAGAPMHVVCQVQDITARKENEARLVMHTREQEALSEVATLVASEAHPRAVFAAAAERIAAMLGADRGSVVRLEHNGTARMVGGWCAARLEPPPLGQLLDMEGATATAAALRTGRTAAVDDADGTSTDDRDTFRGLAEPIEVNGRLWGAVCVGWERPSASDRAPARLARFAHLVSLAVTGAEAREQLSRLASTDHLTGLYNRRAFSDRLEAEVTRSRRLGHPLSLAVFDLDNFKLINDTHGHQMGDGALTEFAGRLMAQRREGDIIARVGGEEFAWILPDTDAEGGHAAAERARRAVAHPHFPVVGPMTASVGVCALDEAQDASELFRHADLALYWAKSNGRDITFLYNAETLAKVTGAQDDRLQDARPPASARRPRPRSPRTP